LSNRARTLEIREGKNIIKFVDENGKELGRVEGFYSKAIKSLVLVPKSIKTLITLEIG